MLRVPDGQSLTDGGLPEISQPPLGCKKKNHRLRPPRALSPVTALAKKKGTLKQQSPEGGTAFPGGGGGHAVRPSSGPGGPHCSS